MNEWKWNGISENIYLFSELPRKTDEE